MELFSVAKHCMSYHSIAYDSIARYSRAQYDIPNKPTILQAIKHK